MAENDFDNPDSPGNFEPNFRKIFHSATLTVSGIAVASLYSTGRYANSCFLAVCGGITGYLAAVYHPPSNQENGI